MIPVSNHPTTRVYDDPTLDGIISDLKVLYMDWTFHSGLSEVTMDVLLKLEARATLRTLQYRKALSEWFCILENASTPNAEEYHLKESAPRYSWLKLSKEESAVIERYNKTCPSPVIVEGLKTNQFKGTDLIRFILDIRHQCVKK